MKISISNLIIVRAKINSQTAFFDLSILYGKNAEEAKRLRAGAGGALKTANRAETNNQEYPPIIQGSDRCPLGGLSLTPGQEKCFDAGATPRFNINL